MEAAAPAEVLADLSGDVVPSSLTAKHNVTYCAWEGALTKTRKSRSLCEDDVFVVPRGLSCEIPTRLGVARCFTIPTTPSRRHCCHSLAILQDFVR